LQWLPILNYYMCSCGPPCLPFLKFSKHSWHRKNWWPTLHWYLQYILVRCIQILYTSILYFFSRVYQYSIILLYCVEYNASAPLSCRFCDMCAHKRVNNILYNAYRVDIILWCLPMPIITNKKQKCNERANSFFQNVKSFFRLL